jgi:N-acetylglutamate synthase-like GNAT family acetyltransferase
MEPPIQIRRATVDDIPALHKLIDASVRVLQARDYSPAQIEGALGTVFGVDTRLIEDGTYFVAEAGGVLAGCGGWSRRKTLFGADRGAGREDTLLDPAHDAARIRAFFVHPEWSRRGIGSLLLETCEQDAARAGFQRFELGATAAGERLYGMRGYVAVDRLETPLGNGESLTVIRMTKTRI